MKYIAEIVPAGSNGWDVKNISRIYFDSKRRCLYFAKYYSFNHDVLIRLYEGSWWFVSYVHGGEIWNDF